MSYTVGTVCVPVQAELMTSQEVHAFKSRGHQTSISG